MNTTWNPPLKLSEEIQDILHVARKEAIKSDGKDAVIQDHHLLLGLLKLNRLFTYSDALLKHAGVSPRKLLKLYKQEKSQIDPPPAGEAIAIDRAVHYAQEEEIVPNKARVELEHLVLGLLDSPNALVKRVFEKAGLSRDNVLKAIPKVKDETPVRFILFSLRETVEVILVVLFLVIVIKQGLGEFRLIPSESMQPTLQVGDRIVVEKLSHWYREPQRGDILVFYPPEPEAILRQDPWSVFLRLTGFSGILYDKESKIDTAFIKRVIGLPGDVVEVRPGDGVYVNGTRLDEPYAEEAAKTCTFVNYCGPVTVPPGMYYMMGDNRNHSADSRYWSFLPEDRIIGRAVLRFFPFDQRIGFLPQPGYPNVEDASPPSMKTSSEALGDKL